MLTMKQGLMAAVDKKTGILPNSLKSEADLDES